ncbi:alpha/beta fold hydrolase [Saliphagus sp. GCM10025308]
MELPDGWSTGTVRTNGVDLQYYRTGEGEPIVLAHGFYDTGRCWERLAAGLAADGYEVLTYDARGHGRSDAPETGYGIEDRVADLRGLVDELGLERPLLLGHSMGGSTVAWAAATHPDLARAIALEDPAGMYGDPDLGPDERAAVVEERCAEWAAQSLEERMSAFDDRDESLARRLAVARAEFDPHSAEIARAGYPLLEDTFAEITCPTLVLKADAETSRRVRDLEAAAALSNGRLVHVPDAGHCIFRDEYEAAFAELRTFCSQHG